MSERKRSERSIHMISAKHSFYHHRQTTTVFIYTKHYTLRDTLASGFIFVFFYIQDTLLGSQEVRIFLKTISNCYIFCFTFHTQHHFIICIQDKQSSPACISY